MTENHENELSNEPVVGHPFFTRCPYNQLWADKERVKTLIDLYQRNEFLCDSKCPDYKKSKTKKKTAKEVIASHFELLGMPTITVLVMLKAYNVCGIVRVTHSRAQGHQKRQP